MKNYIKNYINKSFEVKENILNNEVLLTNIENVAQTIINCYNQNKKILVAGNGGSASDSQHIVAELVSKFMFDRKALNAIALTTNTSILTAVGNDFSHDYIFSRQIQAYGNEGDIFIAISTSGNSKNIIKASEEAKKQGLKIIALTGIKKCLLDDLADITIKVPSEETSIIQESHIMIGHILCAIIEKEVC